MLIDAHCHFFTKNIMTASLTELESTFTHLDHIAQPFSKSRTQSANLEFLTTGVQNTPLDLYLTMKESYGCDFIAVPLMLDLSYTFLAPKDKTLENKRRLSLKLKAFTQKEKGNLKDSKFHAFLNSVADSLDTYERSVIVRDVFENSYEEQIKDLTHIKKQLPNRVFPFFSIDPRRNDEFENGVLGEIEKYIGLDKPFIGLKLYTSLGYSPTHPVLYDNTNHESVYGYCEKHQIPITIHSSIEGFSHMLDQTYIDGDIYYPASGKPVTASHLYEDGIVKYDKNLRSFNFTGITSERLLMLNHPVLWRKVLEKYPNLKINLAHFGGVIQMSKFAKGDQTAFWPAYVIDIMETFPNVYTDLSCYYNPDNNPDYLKDIYQNVYLKLSDSVKSRVQYGSDYYMTALYDTSLKDYIKAFREAFAEDFTKISEENPRKFLDL
jgi:predicted TIM-barrel fold metal-dependent hydrolase